MNNSQLTLGLTIAVVGPLVTLRYLRSSLLLILIFGLREGEEGFVEILRRSLLLTTLSIFLSVAFVASRIWSEIAKFLHRRQFENPAKPTEQDAVKT